MQTIILANGTDAGWNGHLGVPKQLVEIDGERILDRTVRQVIERTALSPIISTTRPELMVPNAEIFCPSEDSVYGNPHPPGYATTPLWNARDHVALLLGDVRYSDAALDEILTPRERWTFFCRFGPMSPGGKPYGGEGWAIQCPPCDQSAYRGLLIHLDLMAIAGQHFWQQYRAWNNKPLGRHNILEHHVIIDDETEDFDFPEHYDAWMRKYRP